MAHSVGDNLSAVLLLLVLLLVAIATAAAGGRIHAAESAASVVGDCDQYHLSANYKGPCFLSINDLACERVCLNESTDNISGECNYLQCWCQNRCTTSSETVTAASAPIPV